MSDSSLTCWTVIRGAADGAVDARAEFARRYERIVRAYLGARWKNSPLIDDLDDAVQDVFVDCLQAGGALERVDPKRGAFRGFLYGVVRNIALRHERSRARAGPGIPSTYEPVDRAPSLARMFDRAWARGLLREAARVQLARARGAERAERRVELLRLCFREDLPIREIARQWCVEAAWLHHEYATARHEFQSALREVVTFHHPEETPAAIDAECAQLVSLF